MHAPVNLEAIANRWGEVRPKVLNVQHVEVFRGRPGAAYSHHAQLAVQGDRLLATWSLGAEDEDAPGQNMVLASSHDGGRTWGAPTVVAAQPGRAAKSVVSSAGLVVVGEKWVAFYGHYEFVP